MPRLGRADDGAKPGEASLPLQARAERCHQLGDPFVHRSAGDGQVEHVGRTRVGSPDEHEEPRSTLRGDLDQRLEGVGTEQGVDGRGVGA